MFQLLVSVSLYGAGCSTEPDPDLRTTVAFIPGAWSATGVTQLIWMSWAVTFREAWGERQWSSKDGKKLGYD